MLEPSSSEEESENETFEDENSDVLSLPSADRRSLSASGDNLSVSGASSSFSPSQYVSQGPRLSRDSQNVRPASPSPSVLSEKEREDIEKNEREEEDRRRRLQLYVFVMRCISYPFNAKQPNDTPRRPVKITKEQLQKIKERFQAFFNKELNIQYDEAFSNAVHSYYEVFLKSDRISNMVRSGGCSADDFRAVFKNNIDKRVRSLPEIDGLSKETVLSSWMAKFDQIFRGDEDPRRQNQRSMSNAVSELVLSKEQLYDMFQNILSVKKYEHTILYNAMQVKLMSHILVRTTR